MATLETHTYSTAFSGLVISASLTIGLAVICTVAFEILRRVRRLPRLSLFSPARSSQEHPSSSSDTYLLGHLFSGRCFLSTRPTPLNLSFPTVRRWPLLWLFRVGMLPEKFFLEHTGLDSAVYIRFLRGCFYFCIFCLLSLMVVLLPLHYRHAPTDVPDSSIAKASLSSLVKTDEGQRLLWVHVICLWVLSAAWILTIAWVGVGALAMRRISIEDVRQSVYQKETQPNPDAGDGVKANRSDADSGWRFRTVIVTNLPYDMRSETALAAYFEEHLRKPETPTESAGTEGASSSPTTKGKLPSRSPSRSRRHPAPARPQSPSPISPMEILAQRVDCSAPLITKIVLVRKMTELHEQVKKRRDVLSQLEQAHIKLAKNVIEAVRERIAEKEVETRGRGNRPYSWSIFCLWRQLWGRGPDIGKTEDGVRGKGNRNPTDIEKGSESQESEYGIDFLVEKLEHHLHESTTDQARLDPKIDPDTLSSDQSSSFWVDLSSLPKVSLDPYQPQIRLKYILVGQTVPAIDYYVTKLNLISTIIEDLRAHPTSFEPASSAFVTFEDVKDAFRARKEMKWHPRRPWNCKVRPAPDTRDLDWDRLVKTNFTGDILRASVAHAGAWAFTLFWIIPVSLLVGLVSLDNLSERIGSLQRYLNRHPSQKALLSSLLPTCLVALLIILVPQLLMLLSQRGQNFITRTKLHHSVLCRFWKFLIFDVVIAFCAGVTALQSFLNVFNGGVDVLEVIATAFPSGAVFFVGWLVLSTGLHSFLEFCLFGRLLVYAFAHNSASPRCRAETTVPPFFAYYYWIPTHLLVVSVVLIFSILNPLVIPFAFIYFLFALTIFKNQFANVYFRRFYEGNGRMIFIRVLRYSLDALVVSQVVVIAFLWVLKYSSLGGACIPLVILTVSTKLAITRYYVAKMDSLEEQEAEAVCAPGGLLSLLPETKSGCAEDRTPAIDALEKAVGSIGNLIVPDPQPPLTSLPTRLPKALRKMPSVPISATFPRIADLSFHASMHSLPYRYSSPGSERRPILERRSPSCDSTCSEERILPDESTPLGTTGHAGGDIHGAQSIVPFPAPPLLQGHPLRLYADSPDPSCQYDNPFFVEPLDFFLWLPISPLRPVDLRDTVNWHGRACVSSQGGDGQLGGWKLFEDGVCDDVAGEGSIRPPLETLVTMADISEEAQTVDPGLYSDRTLTRELNAMQQWKSHSKSLSAATSVQQRRLHPWTQHDEPTLPGTAPRGEQTYGEFPTSNEHPLEPWESLKLWPLPRDLLIDAVMEEERNATIQRNEEERRRLRRELQKKGTLGSRLFFRHVS